MIRIVPALAALAFAIGAVSAPALAQTDPTAPPKPTDPAKPQIVQAVSPRNLQSAPPIDPLGVKRDAHDFTGMWGNVGGDHFQGVVFPPDTVPPAKVLSTIDSDLQPWALKLHQDFNHQEYDLGHLQETVEGDCLPFTMPGERQESRIGFRFISTPAVLFILGGSDNFRLVHIGKTQPKHLQPTWMGHSVGHWEGDTLMIDTAGFNDKGTFEDGVHHTDKLHVTAEYKLIRNGAVLQMTYVYDDPGSLLHPFKFGRVLPLNPNGIFVDQEDRCSGRASY